MNWHYASVLCVFPLFLILNRVWNIEYCYFNWSVWFVFYSCNQNYVMLTPSLPFENKLFLCVCMSICHVYGCPWRPEEGIGSPGAGANRHVMWVLGTKMGALEEQTKTSELFLSHLSSPAHSSFHAPDLGGLISVCWILVIGGFWPVQFTGVVVVYNQMISRYHLN